MRVERALLEELSEKKFNIGYQGEQNHTQVIISCPVMFRDYPDAVASMVVKPPQGDLYPVSLTREVNDLIWDISDADVAIPGEGILQLTFTDGEGEEAEIIKTVYGSYSVNASLVADGEAPDPVQSWLDEAGAALSTFETEIGEIRKITTATEADEGLALSPKTVTNGKVTEWEYIDLADPETVTAAVDDWLDDHPEATTTVEDGAITEAKLNDSLKEDLAWQDDVDELKNALTLFDASALTIEQGYYAAASGAKTSSSNWCRSDVVNPDTIVICNSLRILLVAFTAGGSYVGTWNGTAFSTASLVESSYLTEANVRDFSRKYPGYIFKVNFYNSGNALTPATVASDAHIYHLNDGLIDSSSYGLRTSLKMLSGYWAVANGASTTSLNWMKSEKYIPDDVKTLYCLNDLLIYLQAWNKSDGSYVGTWNGSAFTTTYVNRSGLKYYDLEKFRSNYSSYKFTIVVESSKTRVMETADFYKILTTKNVDNEIKKATSYALTPTDVYEHGEISLTTDMYIHYPAGSPLNRARAKKEHIQEVPDGATTFNVKIESGIFANGLYKVGWAFYTDNYVQITASVKGWYSSEQSFSDTVVSGAKYFMFYIASVNSNTEINIANLDLNSLHVYFNTTGETDIASMLLSPTVKEKCVDIQKEIDEIKGKDGINYFIYSVNHRGYSFEAPENTIPAYILSKKKGFEYAECDVQFTSDGVAVLMHDFTINRTARNSDGTELSTSINIGDITYEQALQYDYGIWKGQKWAGTDIPTFDEFIVACKKLSLHPFIELKDIVNGTYWTDARIEAVANSIKAAGMERNVSFISFSVSALQKMSVYFPDARLGLGFEGTYSTANFEAYITNAETLVDGKRSVIATVNYTSMTDELYEMLVEAGISPLVWTVNTKEAILSLDKTVVGVLSDYYNAGDVLIKNMFDSLP